MVCDSVYSKLNTKHTVCDTKGIAAQTMSLMNEI